MKIPHKKTEVETEIGAEPLSPEKRTGAGEKRVDYSANACHALTVPADCDDKTALDAACADEKIKKLMEGMEIVKSIVVKNKLVNIILKPAR